MSARRFDSPLRYNVDSHSRVEIEHLVEIDAWHFNGECQCEHFQIRLRPLLKAGAEPSNATRCHHILEARDQFIDDVGALIKKRQKETGYTRKNAYHNEQS